MKEGKKKFWGEDVWVEFLLSSCSLVRLYVNLQVKVTEKKKWKFFKVFCGSGFVSYTRWGAMLIENSITWANWKDKVKFAVENKKNDYG